MEENKTAEEFIREKVRLKYNAINKLTKALWTYDVNGEECLRWAKEFSGLQLTQQQSANAELKKVCAEYSKDISHQNITIEELKKQNEEATKLIQMHLDSLDLSNLDFYNKYGFNVAETFPRTREFISKHTT